MKKFLKSLLLTALCAAGAYAQMTAWTVVQYDKGATVPGSCNQAAFYIKTGPPEQLYFCDTGTGAFVNIPVTVNSTGTVTIAAAKTLTVNNTITFAATDGQTYTFPVASGTVVTQASTDTLTNKTLTNPVMIGPAAVACGATCSATAGQLIAINQAGGSAVTIPAATGTGSVIRMYISVATTSAQDKVLLTTVTDTIIGTAQGENAGTAKVFVGNAGTYHSLQMPFAGSQPSGGFIGDTITCTDVASTIWKCDIQYQAGTTPTTPYSTATT